MKKNEITSFFFSVPYPCNNGDWTSTGCACYPGYIRDATERNCISECCSSSYNWENKYVCTFSTNAILFQKPVPSISISLATTVSAFRITTNSTHPPLAVSKLLSEIVKLRHFFTEPLPCYNGKWTSTGCQCDTGYEADDMKTYCRRNNCFTNYYEKNEKLSAKCINSVWDSAKSTCVCNKFYLQVSPWICC